MWLLLLIVIVSIMLAIKVWYNMQSGVCKSSRQLHGKLAVVTGASSGIGLATAEDFARRGARVIMACRNMDKARAVADEIISRTGNSKVEVQLLDTSSLKSVRAFASAICRKEKQINILINNAGIGAQKRLQVTEDGLELVMATNHFGHFLLTNMLGKVLKAGAPSRIVFVSSFLHKEMKSLDPKELKSSNDFNLLKAYSQSKLCNLLMAKELAHKLRGTGVSSYSVNPGMVSTDIWFKKKKMWIIKCLGYLAMLMGKGAESGAQTSIYCAVGEDAGRESGLYYTDCKKDTPSLLGQDPHLAAKVWAASADAVKLRQTERNI